MFDINDDIHDSRDVIERLDELREMCEGHATENDDDKAYDFDELDDDQIKAALDSDDYDELKFLLSLEDAFSHVSDWIHGEQIIKEEYFVEYITDLISDCYELPDSLNTNHWPYNHVTIDYEAAADEAKVDYTDACGYLVRYC